MYKEVINKYIIKKRTKEEIENRKSRENIPKYIQKFVKEDIFEYINKNGYIYIAGNSKNIYDGKHGSNFFIELQNKYPEIESLNCTWNIYIKKNIKNNIFEYIYWDDSARYDIYCFQF